MKYNVIEDCLKLVPNKFEVVVLASQRAYNLSSGAKPTVDHVRSDKITVIALLEIASGNLDLDSLYRDLVERDSRTKKGVDDFMVERSVLDLSDVVEDGDSSKESTFDVLGAESKSSDGGVSATDVIFDNDID